MPGTYGSQIVVIPCIGYWEVDWVSVKSSALEGACMGLKSNSRVTGFELAKVFTVLMQSLIVFTVFLLIPLLQRFSSLSTVTYIVFAFLTD